MLVLRGHFLSSIYMSQFKVKSRLTSEGRGLANT